MGSDVGRLRGDRGDGGGRDGTWRGRLVAVLAGVGTLAIVVFFMDRGLIDIDFPDLFGGGESDPAPGGRVIYEGQTARSASERFLIDIGNGEAVVSVKAKQNHDSPGNIFSGDFQPTNGTSSVSDPDDGDLPASLRVKVDYCAEGVVTTEVAPDPETDEMTRSITFDMGQLFVCDATLEHTVENDSAFQQDDTPNDFHGNFVSFVANAVETTAAAAPCPNDELERFTDEDIVDYMEEQLAERFDVPRGRVEVVAGTPGRSDRSTQRDLRDRLESYANRRDPEHPRRRYEALTIEYLSGNAEAVADSCYRDPGGTDLDTLEDIDAPRPERRARG
jgi:hypothetical protein